MELLLVLFLLLGLFGLGVWFAEWPYVLGLVALFLVVAIFLAVNDGWYGRGWGEFGIKFNLLVVALGLAAASAGVSRGRR